MNYDYSFWFWRINWSLFDIDVKINLIIDNPFGYILLYKETDNERDI